MHPWNEPVIRLQSTPFNEAISVAIVHDGRMNRAVVKELKFTNIDDGELTQPAMHLSKTAAQILMDDLWNCGIRPTEGTGSAGAMAATQRHLEDMRTLVFRRAQDAED